MLICLWSIVSGMEGKGCTRHCTSCSCDASDFLAALTRWHEKVPRIGSRLSLKVDSWSRGCLPAWLPFLFFFFLAFPRCPFSKRHFGPLSTPCYFLRAAMARGPRGPPTHGPSGPLRNTSHISQANRLRRLPTSSLMQSSQGEEIHFDIVIALEISQRSGAYRFLSIIDTKSCHWFSLINHFILYIPIIYYFHI